LFTIPFIFRKTTTQDFASLIPKNQEKSITWRYLHTVKIIV
jgi:hypothetical protein